MTERIENQHRDSYTDGHRDARRELARELRRRLELEKNHWISPKQIDEAINIVDRAMRATRGKR